MDKLQYTAIVAILANDAINDDDKVNEINKVLGIDISDETQARTFKEKVIGNDTITITKDTGTVAVEFSGVAVTGPSFAIAFIATLLNVLADRALDKFLPEPVPADKENKSGSKRDGLGSPAPQRSLPVRGGNY